MPNSRLFLFASIADDLPLNVSRETLQSNKFLKQVKNIIVKRIISLFTKLSEEEPAKWEKVQEVYGNVLKLGAVEDTKNRDKLVPLTRFKTNIRNDTSLDQVSGLNIFVMKLSEVC